MKTHEFNFWCDKYREALSILKDKDPLSAEDLQANVKINSMKRTITYIGENTDLARCYLPAESITALRREKYKWNGKWVN